MLIRRPLAAVLAAWLVTLVSAQEPKYDLDATVDQVRLGEGVAGPAVTAADLKGKVVLIEVWSSTSSNCLASIPLLVRWHGELGGYGLLMIGSHSGEQPAEVVKAKAQSLGIEYSVIDGVFVKGGTITLPHVYLFDHTGKCVYRGAPAGAEAPLRAAVGTALAELGPTVQSKSVAALLELLKKGQPPVAVVPRVVALLKSKDQAAAEEAQRLLDRLTEAGLKKLELAEKFKETDPIEAYFAIESVPADYRGTPLAAKAAALLAALKKDKAVVEELKARQALETVRKVDAFLAKQAGGQRDPKDPAFQRQYALVLGSLKATVQQMQKAYPAARATQEAARIADKYGVALK